MENASKALIIAGEILIALLVVSLIVSLVVIFGKFSRNMSDKISEDKLSVFNNNFLQYDERFDITAQEVVTALNFAKKNNDSYDLSNKDRNSIYFVDVSFSGTDGGFDGDFFADASAYNDPQKFKQKINNFMSANNINLFSVNVSDFKVEKLTANNNVNYWDRNKQKFVKGKEGKTLNYIRATKWKEVTDSNSDIKMNAKTNRVISIKFTKTVVKGYDFNFKTRDDFVTSSVSYDEN